MKRIFVTVALFAGLAFPAFAQDKPEQDAAGQEAADMISVEEALEVIAGIKADKAKLKAYCDSQEFYMQADEATEKKDAKAAAELEAKGDKAAEALGEDFEDVLDLSGSLAPESEEGKKLLDALDDLDAACET